MSCMQSEMLFILKLVDGLPEGMLGVDAQVEVLQLRRAHAQQVNKII